MDDIRKWHGTIKLNMKKYNWTQNLSCHDQVVVSRLKMGYTRITQAYRLDKKPQLECQTCQRTYFMGMHKIRTSTCAVWNRPTNIGWHSGEGYEYKNIGLYNEIWIKKKKKIMNVKKTWRPMVLQGQINYLNQSYDFIALMAGHWIFTYS
jgi:hypothetical protein